MIKKYFLSILFIFIYIACNNTTTKATAEKLIIPEINLDSAKIDLGKKLFFDPLLSENGTIACASCHKPEFSFADNRSISPGVFNRLGNRNAPAIINPILQSDFFHDGRARSLEEQAIGPLDNPLEMGNVNYLIPKLKRIPKYRSAFLAVFNDSIKMKYLLSAISEFERSIVFKSSPYDRFMNGDSTALSKDQKEGMKLFFNKANCATCHTGANFTDNDYHNIGFF
jgi:cytochrome c peroxidase